MSVSVSVNVSFSFVAFICVPKCPRSFFSLLRFTPQKVPLPMLYFDIDPKSTKLVSIRCVHTHTHNLSAMLLDMLSKRVCGSMFDEIEKHTHAHTHTQIAYSSCLCTLYNGMIFMAW